MEKSGSRWTDSLGIAASALCAVHCAATPILLAFLPTLQFTEWMASPRFHQIAALVCVSLVSMVIWPAFRKYRDFRVLGLSSTGLSMILAAAFVLPDSCCSSSCCSTHESSAGDSPKLVHSSHDHAGHDHSGHDHSSHDHSGHDHSSNAHSEPISSSALASVHKEPEQKTQVATAGLWMFSLERIQPWLTPIGGVLLIAAHFLNMRRAFSKCGSNCKCVETDAKLPSDTPAAQAA